MRKIRLSLHNCDSGVALIEFAFALPLLILMFVGLIELTRYAILTEKLDKAANAMADFVTQGKSVSVEDLDTFSKALPEIMYPFPFSGTAIFSSVTYFPDPVPPCSGGTSCISWQHSELGDDPSEVGAPGGNAALPGGYAVIPGQNVIVAEVYLSYTPLLDMTGTLIPALAPHKMYEIAIYKPRQDTLADLDP